MVWPGLACAALVSSLSWEGSQAEFGARLADTMVALGESHYRCLAEPARRAQFLQQVRGSREQGTEPKGGGGGRDARARGATSYAGPYYALPRHAGTAGAAASTIPYHMHAAPHSAPCSPSLCLRAPPLPACCTLGPYTCEEIAKHNSE